MVSTRSIEEQLKRIGFNHHGWGRTEVRELQNIIMPDEEIAECVNGLYEGGFALLLATDLRVLLVDKKPLNYLTVEDLRFDMINEIDYSHRLIGAHIRISAGETNLQFNSINQARLRKLIGHVQHAMAEAKKKQSYHQEGQTQHLERINYQLRSYLIKQYEQQQKLQDQLREVQGAGQAGPKLSENLQTPAEVINPDPELADYLLAQGLLAQHQEQIKQAQAADLALGAGPGGRDQMAELYADGLQEVFGKQGQSQAGDNPDEAGNPEEVNPLKVAYAKLPQAMRNRKFGRQLFRHAPSQEAVSPPAVPVPAAEI